MSLDLNNVAVLVGALVPLGTALLVARGASPAVKAVVTLALQAVQGVVLEGISAATGDHGYDWGSAASNAVVGFLVGTASYYSLLRPVGATAGVQAATSGRGLGTNTGESTAPVGNPGVGRHGNN